MTENDIIESYFEEQYGVHVQPVIDVYPLGNFTRLTDECMTRANALLRDLPFLANQLRAEREAACAYKVIFDKGLGVLQQSASNSERLRANVVEFGSNNKIVGQAELESLHLKVTSPSLAVFEVASIITNQYYLARIDKELTSLHKELKNVTRLLENSKESELCSHERALQSVSDNLSDVLQNDDYRRSTLYNVQHIRMSALSLVEYYHRERINVLETWSKAKSRKASYTQVFLSNYKDNLNLYSRAFHVYALAYVEEVILSQVKEADSITRIAKEIQAVAYEYNQEYGGRFDRFNNQIIGDNNGRIIEANASLAGGAATGIAAGIAGIGMLPVTALLVGGIWVGNKIKGKKAEVLEQFKESLKEIEESNIHNNHIAEIAITSLGRLNQLYNNRVELLIKKDAMYMKVK